MSSSSIDAVRACLSVIAASARLCARGPELSPAEIDAERYPTVAVGLAWDDVAERSAGTARGDFGGEALIEHIVERERQLVAIVVRQQARVEAEQAIGMNGGCGPVGGKLIDLADLA